MVFKVPSGRTFGPKDINLMRDFDKVDFLSWSDQPILLNSKNESNIYLGGRHEFTDDPRLLKRIGARIMDSLRFGENGRNNSVYCLIGVPMAGIALAAAGYAAEVSDTNTAFKPKTCLRLMRQIKKTHGRESEQGWVIGKPDYAAHQYALIENTTTTGRSVIEAAQRLVEDGYELSKVDCVIFVDRGQGALKALASVGFRRVVVVYHLLDIIYAYRHLELWAEFVLDRIENEITSTQLV
jgi:orotate phosphoribosyltransferase